MAGENKPALVALRTRRDEVIEMLTDGFARDALDVGEFEERVDLAHRATSVEALEQVVQDLEPVRAGVPAPSEALAARPAADQALVPARASRRRAWAILSSIEREGRWRVPQQMRVVAVMGAAELDFRDAELPPGEIELHVTMVMGSVEIIVPPTLAVECDGIAVMGAFESVDRAPATPDPDRPLLRITGVAVMGALEIETRLAGESRREARRRMRHERRDRRRLRGAHRKP
jgi:hypothetical protein